MVVIEGEREISDVSQEERDDLREERKRTGRYVALGTAIFLSVLGVYQALIQGTPEYAALFAPVVIMFIYLLWILHASRNQNARLRKMRQLMEEQNEENPKPQDLPLANKIKNRIQDGGATSSSVTIEIKNDKQFNRSYSIA